MTKVRLETKKLVIYKNQLFKLKEDLTKDIKNMSHNPARQDGEQGDVSGHVLHIADVATDMYDREFNLGLASNEREVLYKIENALKKIEDKTFGVCVECKKLISEQRLKAIPYTEMCLKCQEKLESRP